MSSYPYAERAQGPPSTGTEDGNPAGDITAATDCADPGWFCEHRNLHAMPTFTAAVGSAPAVARAADGGARLAFDRGDRGFAAFNATGTAWTLTSETGLPDGAYCDVATGPAECASGTVTVADGRITATVGPDGFLAVHVDATPPRA